MQHRPTTGAGPDGASEWPPPEAVAAGVNALVIVCLPLALIVAMWLTPGSNTSVTVRPSSTSGDLLLELAGQLFVIVPFVPFAVFAAWRTWTHARRYLNGDGTGWQGVAEAGAIGFVPAIVILRGGIATRPQDAAPYVVAYGGGALLSGLLIGLILRWTALLTLKYVLRARRPH